MIVFAAAGAEIVVVVTVIVVFGTENIALVYFQSSLAMRANHTQGEDTLTRRVDDFHVFSPPRLLPSLKLRQSRKPGVKDTSCGW